MKKNILKFQLVVLFALTIFSFVTFYYGDTLPDNYFTITSDNSGNFLGYYFFSLITYGSYFSGPWTLLAFFIFAVSSSFIYDKRETLVDSLNIFTLLFFISSISYFTFPDSLGRGLFFLYKEFFDPMWLGIYCATSFILFMFGTFRSSFKEHILSMFKFIKEVPVKLKSMNSKFKGAIDKTTKVIPSSVDVKKKVTTLLKSEKEESSVDSGALPQFMANQVRNNEEVKQDEVVQPTLMDTQVPPAPVVEPAGLKTQGVRESARIAAPKTLNTTIDPQKDNQYFNLVTSMSDTRSEKSSSEPDSQYFEEIIGLLEVKLQEFKIEGKIVNVLKGPVVDTFELELGAGVKVSKVTGASEDLSLALFGAPIRIVYPMKGRTTVGIEVPRNPREIIYLDEVLTSKDFQRTDMALPLAMGKNAFGEPFVIDLGGCPHMLVAGATGAGKSVFINSLLVSLLVKKSPKKMQLILIDPKQLELALYQKLPHLIMPVVTDAKTASIALLWAVQEMERRYAILKDMGVRNIAGFNDKLKRATPDLLAKIHHHYEDHDVEDYELPHLVVVVDEFADLILTKAGKEIEQNIARLAAKARAAGIHLVLATQRPSVDVITGVIKSNFPTRVSFRVTSQTDSRTILDKIGAERLLGKGDMLYKHGITTQRVHSSYVDEEEIEALTKKLEGMDQAFNTNAMDFLENGGEVEVDEYTYGSHITGVDDKSDDAMYSEALKIVMESRSASASMLQRRLRIGYNRAANLVEEMERRGVVGPAQGSKPRKVLMSSGEASL